MGKVPWLKKTPVQLFARDPVLNRFINVWAEHNNKFRAKETIGKAFYYLKKTHGVKNPLVFFREALENGTPSVLTSKVVVAGRTLHIPVACQPKQARPYAMRYLKQVAQKRDEGEGHVRLAEELVRLHRKEGGVMQMRDELHRTAESNRSFIHFLGRR